MNVSHFLLLKYINIVADVCWHPLMLIRVCIFTLLSNISTDRELYLKQLYTRFLSKSNCIHQLSTVFSQPRSTVYLITGVNVHSYYIGETGLSLIERYKMHLIKVKYGNRNDYTDTASYLHQYMRITGLEDYIIIPIYSLSHNQQSALVRKRIEMRLIKKYKPPLNSKYLLNGYSRTNTNTRPLNNIRNRPRKSKRRRMQLVSNNDSSMNSKFHYCSMSELSLSSSYIFRNNQYATINEILPLCNPASNATILYIPGLIDQSNLITIRRRFYNIKILSPLFVTLMNLYQLLLYCASYHLRLEFTFLMQVDINNTELHVDIGTRNLLEKIARHPTGKLSEFKNISIIELLYLYCRTSELHNHQLKELARQYIMKRLLKSFHIRYIPNIILRIPYSPFIRKSDMNRIMNIILKSFKLPEIINKFILGKVRLIMIKQQNVSQILSNNIKFCLKYSGPNTVPCLCSGESQSNDTHDLTSRPENFDHHSIIYKVLKYNANNIPVPTHATTADHIIQGMDKFITELTRLTGKRISSFKRIRIMQLIRHSTLMNNNNNNNNFDQHELITQSDVYHVRRLLSGYVIGGADKNNGCLLVSCPKWYNEMLKKTYIDDHEHYELYDNNDQSQSGIINTDSILNSFRTAYNRHRLHTNPLTQNWSDIGRLLPGKLPYAYISIKNKDVLKVRPIVSYKKHILRKVFKCAANALFFLLQQLPENIKHFALFNISKLKSTVNEIQMKSNNIWNNTGNNNDHNVRYNLLSVDVKNMYTNLTHSSILRSVHWLIKITSTENNYGRGCRNRDRIAVSIDPNKIIKTEWGRSYNRLISIEILLGTLMEIVEFDLSNVYFTVGHQLLRQINGIPMGGLLSAHLAVLVCIYNEHQFMSSLGIDQRYIHGIRYIDDLILFAVYQNGNDESFRKSHLLLESAMLMYDSALELEKQPPEDGNIYPFLSANLKIEFNEIIISPQMKNWNEIMTSGKQKLLKFQSFHSYSSTATKSGVLTCTLHRLYANSSNEQILINAVHQLYCELNTIGYPLSIIIRALKQMFIKTHLPVWQQAANQLYLE